MESVESISSLLSPAKAHWQPADQHLEDETAGEEPGLGGEEKPVSLAWEFENSFLTLSTELVLGWIFHLFFSSLHHFCLFGCRPRRKQHPAPSIEATTSSRKCWASTRPRCGHKFMPSAQISSPFTKLISPHISAFCQCFYGLSSLCFHPNVTQTTALDLLSWIQHCGPLQGNGHMGARRIQNAWSWHALATALGFTSGA